MAEAVVTSGEILSFYQLFAEKELTVEIPIIQRDYAQGRKSEREVRTKFLGALFNYLDENIPNRDLDFVYGSIKDIDSVKTFIPLDGQQRLTTLFLLHWYLALLAGRRDELQNSLAKDGRSLFTYKTRSSSREFCDALMIEDFSYDTADSEKKISEMISNEGWYYLSWKYDPTVSAMLEMLDAIEEKFRNRPEFFDRLIDIENPIITFQFLNLEEFHLTDDLYIKMNSRGKQLSSFENFKAKLGQRIAELFDGDSKTYELKFNKESVLRSPSEYFSIQIDTNWLNHFWKKAEYDPKTVDGYLMNFIRIVLSNSTALLNENVTNDALKVLFKTQDAIYDHHDRSTLSYYSFDELGAITKGTIEQLISSFDQLLRIQEIKEEHLPDALHFDIKDAFERAFDHRLPTQDRLRLHAFLSYLIRYEDEIEGLNEWVRVIYNLTENTRIESADELKRGLKEIESMLPEASKILESLAAKKSKIGFFYGRQIEEERIKACLIRKSEKWADLIKTTEKHLFFQGQIGFLLEFSGIVDFYLEHENCEWNEKSDEEYFSMFYDYSEKSRCVFGKLHNGENDDYLWERAVLTKGDYLIPSTCSRYHFLTTSITDRDNSWKRLLRLNRKDDDELKSRRLLVKEVFDDDRFDPNDFKKSCEVLLKDKIDDWRSYFIKRPELISDCSRGFMHFEDEMIIKLLETTRLTYHFELRTRNLYYKYIENDNFSPFQDTRYIMEYGYEGHSHIYIGNWMYRRKEYQLKIYFDKDYDYGVEFSKVRGSNQESDYADQIREVCAGLNFEFDTQTWNGYYKTTENEEDAAEIISNLVDKLKQLE